jgi:hypothetical protein
MVTHIHVSDGHLTLNPVPQVGCPAAAAPQYQDNHTDTHTTSKLLR